MGLLSGMAAGFGQGMAGIGDDMLRQQKQDEQDRIWRERYATQQDGRNDSAILKAELMASRAAAGGGGSGGVSLDEMNAVATDPKYQALRATAGGTTTDRIQAADSIRGGAAGVSDAEMGPSQDGKDGKRVYRPNEAESLLADSRKSFFDVMGIRSGKMKDTQEGLTEERSRELSDDYVDSGSQRSAEGVLLSKGKDLRGANGGSAVDGTVPKGSVGESERAKNFAAGRASDADAAATKEGKGTATNIAKVDTDAEGYMVHTFRNGKTERALIDGQPVKSGRYEERIDKATAALAKDINFMSKSPAEKRIAAAESIRSTVSEQAPAAKSDAKPAAIDKVAASAVKADMQAGKITREEALKRLKALGYN